MSLPVIELRDGVRFVATERYGPERMLYPDDLENEEQLKHYLAHLWNDAYLARGPELARLTTIQKLYAGFHYQDPEDNRQREVTNYCFSTVETVHPVLTEVVPRPEVVPRGGVLNTRRANRIAEFATYLMDISRFDRARDLATRDMLKFGWDVTQIDVDPRNGVPRPWNPDVFEFFPDPTATHEDQAEYFCFGWPIPTRRLRAMFPEQAGEIKPDNIVSPAFKARVLPRIEAADVMFPEVGPQLGYAVSTSGSPSGVSSLYTVDPGERRVYGETTFVAQFLIRHYGKVPIRYEGHRLVFNRALEVWVKVPGQYETVREPACETGWCVALVTYGGAFLGIHPLDEAFLMEPSFNNLPFVIGRDYADGHEFNAIGEIDQIASKNRGYNRRIDRLNQALELESTPVLRADSDSGIDITAGPFDPGDRIAPRRGSVIEWVKFQGPGAQHFEMLGTSRSDMDNVSGVHDVTQGRRPVGIEAFSAIKALQEAAQTRIRAKERSLNRKWSEVLSKMVGVASRKMAPLIWFKATNGQITSINRDDLAGQFEVRFAEGSGLPSAQRETRELAIKLYEAGVTDEIDLFTKLDYPDWRETYVRVQRQRQAAAMAQAKAARATEVQRR